MFLFTECFTFAWPRPFYLNRCGVIGFIMVTNLLFRQVKCTPPSPSTLKIDFLKVELKCHVEIKTLNHGSPFLLMDAARSPLNAVSSAMSGMRLSTVNC